MKEPLGEFQFECKKCKKVHERSIYCIAQQAMGHAIVFTCDCGEKFIVPKIKPK